MTTAAHCIWKGPFPPQPVEPVRPPATVVEELNQLKVSGPASQRLLIEKIEQFVTTGTRIHQQEAEQALVAHLDSDGNKFSQAVANLQNGFARREYSDYQDTVQRFFADICKAHLSKAKDYPVQQKLNEIIVIARGDCGVVESNRNAYFQAMEPADCVIV